jgi:hypothetical protein
MKEVVKCVALTPIYFLRIVDIYLDDKKENWWLHVEKIETHNVDSLTRREEELSEIALKANLGSYDGWDVGPVLK